MSLRFRGLGVIATAMLAGGPQALAQEKPKETAKKYHCSVKKDGTWVEDAAISSRKDCKKAGGKWEKLPGHDKQGDDKDDTDSDG